MQQLLWNQDHDQDQDVSRIWAFPGCLCCGCQKCNPSFVCEFYKKKRKKKAQINLRALMWCHVLRKGIRLKGRQVNNLYVAILRASTQNCDETCG